MRHVRTYEDIEALREAGVRTGLVELAAAKLADLVAAYQELGDEFDPDQNGEITVIQPGDNLQDLPDVGLHDYYRGLVGVPKDYVAFHSQADAWEVVVCFSNSYAVTFLVGSEVPLPPELADELRRTAAPGRVIAMLAAGWDETAVSSMWHGTAEEFVHVAYLAPHPEGVPDSLLVAKDGDSSIVRDVFEPLFATIAGLVDVAVGCRLTYAADVSWAGTCEFLLLDVEGGDEWEPTGTVALRVVSEPGDLCFGSVADLEAFLIKSVDGAVQRLRQAKGGQDA